MREGSANLPLRELHDLGFHDRGRRRDRASLGLGGRLLRDYRTPLLPPPRTNASDQLLS